MAKNEKKNNVNSKRKQDIDLLRIAETYLLAHAAFVTVRRTPLILTRTDCVFQKHHLFCVHRYLIKWAIRKPLKIFLFERVSFERVSFENGCVFFIKMCL